MKFGVTLPLGRITPPGEFQSGRAVRDIALAVEKAGVTGASLSEHPVPDAHWLHNDPAAHDALDPFTALAFVAAATTRLVCMTTGSLVGTVKCGIHPPPHRAARSIACRWLRPPRSAGQAPARVGIHCQPR